MEVNFVRSKIFTVNSSGLPTFTMMYILALEPLKANQGLYEITLPGVKTVARYSAYADDVNAYVKCNAEIDEVSKGISKYADVTQVRRSTATSLWACGWVHEKESLFSDLSIGRTSLSIYSVSGLDTTSNWKRTDWRLEKRLRFVYGLCGDFL